MDKRSLIAAIMNRAWWVRHYPRSHQRAKRAQALELLAAQVRAALEDRPDDDEAVLYAIAEGLYDPHDPRFIR
ncbi:MAG TPA: hypothetical protein VFV90_07650 [Usitatibacter sp.]|nr:hypothetical protein [Usitatibacter sp.]